MMTTLPTQHLLPKVSIWDKFPQIGDLNTYQQRQNQYYLPLWQGKVFAKGQCLSKEHAPWQSVYRLQTQSHIFYVTNALAFLIGLTGFYTQKDDPEHALILELIRQRLNIQHFLSEPILNIECMNTSQNTFDDELKPMYWHAPVYGIDMVVWAKQTTWDSLSKTWIKFPQAGFAMGDIPLRLPIWVGNSKVTLQDYQNLRCGDVVLVEHAYFDANGQGKCLVGSLAMQIYYDDALYFLGWEQNTMNNYPDNQDYEDEDDYRASVSNDDDDDENEDEAQNDENDHQSDKATEEFIHEALEEHEDAQDASQEDLDHDVYEPVAHYPNAELHTPPQKQEAHPFAHIPVRLDFSLGSLAMTVGKIAELSEQTVLPLPQNLPGQVAIYANKQVIAYGEMVAVDQQLGVRITQILHKEAS